jgi:hypothetical protein
VEVHSQPDSEAIEVAAPVGVLAIVAVIYGWIGRCRCSLRWSWGGEAGDGAYAEGEDKGAMNWCRNTAMVTTC